MGGSNSGYNQNYYSKGTEGLTNRLTYESEVITLGASRQYNLGYKGVKSWGATLKALDSQLYPSFYMDKDFLKKRRVVLNLIKNTHPENADDLFDAYNRLFRLLSLRMAIMGVYPAKPVSYLGKTLRK